MSYSKTKSTKRFNFSINRNPTAKKSGSNVVTISTNGETDRYSAGTTSLTMTIREANSLQSFLNGTLGGYVPEDSGISF